MYNFIRNSLNKLLLVTFLICFSLPIQTEVYAQKAKVAVAASKWVAKRFLEYFAGQVIKSLLESKPEKKKGTEEINRAEFFSSAIEKIIDEAANEANSYCDNVYHSNNINPYMPINSYKMCYLCKVSLLNRFLEPDVIREVMSKIGANSNEYSFVQSTLQSKLINNSIYIVNFRAMQSDLY